MVDLTVETRYFCTGTCGAVVTQEQYDQGLTKCGDESCNMHDKPFERGLFCVSCEKRIGEEEKDQHQH